MKLQTSSWPPDNFSNFDTNNSAQLHQIQLSIFHYLGHFLLLLLTRELTLLLVIMVCLGKDRTRLCKIPKKISQNQPQHFYFFISHQSLFITFQIKKIITKQKISLFYTKYSYFFPHINQICYSTSPLPPVQSIAKHSHNLQVSSC
jgi:hypothetical protein